MKFTLLFAIPVIAEDASGAIIEVGVLRMFNDSLKFDLALAYDYYLLTPVLKTHTKFPFLPLGNMDSVMEGDEIYTCGYPIGIKQQFVTKGIVSTKYIEEKNSIFNGKDTVYYPRFQALLDITLNRGNSGGAIIKIGSSEENDKVIGIADFIVTPSGSQVEQIIDFFKARQNYTTVAGSDPNKVYADIFEILSNTSIGVSGCVSINHLVSGLGRRN